MATTLGAARVKNILSLQYASHGCPKAEVLLESGEPPAVGEDVSFTVGTLVILGRVTRSGLAAPDRPHVVVMGGAGWDAEVVAPLSWHDDGGVRLQTVLADLSTAAGQVIELPGDSIIGEHYEVIGTRAGDPVKYSDALDELADEGLCGRWRVDPDGVTRFGPRPGVEVTARATVLGRDGGPGYTRFGIDDPLQFVPGNTLSGAPITRLVVREDNGELTAETWTTTAAPSIRSSIRAMVQRHLQEYVRTYLVADVLPDGRLDLTPPEDAAHLPEMAAVQAWTLGGGTATPRVGAEVLVVFRDRRRSRPVALAFAPGQPDEVELDAADEIRLGATATRGVARLNDVVTTLLPPATFTGTIGGSPAAGMVVWAGQTMGNITTASAKVKAE